MLGAAGPRGFVLHTADGGVDFLPGVNLGATTPGHQPGELAITARHHRRWFGQMGSLGIRAVRIYTIHPPAFYRELVRYNDAHPEVPLYLVHGVYLPDETYPSVRAVCTTQPSAAPSTTSSSTLPPRARDAHAPAGATARASGRWRMDVSRWLVAWIVGVEWDSFGVQRRPRASERLKAGHGAVAQAFRDVADRRRPA